MSKGITTPGEIELDDFGVERVKELLARVNYVQKVPAKAPPTATFASSAAARAVQCL